MQCNVLSSACTYVIRSTCVVFLSGSSSIFDKLEMLMIVFVACLETRRLDHNLLVISWRLQRRSARERGEMPTSCETIVEGEGSTWSKYAFREGGAHQQNSTIPGDGGIRQVTDTFTTLPPCFRFDKVKRTGRGQKIRDQCLSSYRRRDTQYNYHRTISNPMRVHESLANMFHLFRLFVYFQNHRKGTVSLSLYIYIPGYTIVWGGAHDYSTRSQQI